MQSPSFRVLTLNCWNVSEPLVERMRLIRTGIEALRPDLIGLQEIVVRRDGFDQGALVLNGLGYERVFGAGFRWNERELLLPHDHLESDAFGNLIASRWPIVRSEVRALPGVESGERRSALGALIDSPNGLVPLVVTHLNWKYHHGNFRERQVSVLADFVWDWTGRAREWSPGMPVLPPVVVGDMNADPDSTEIRFLSGLASLDGRSTYLQDAWRIAGDGGPGFTWDNVNPYAAYSFEPNRRIDYIFVGLPDGNGRGRIVSARLAMNQPSGGVYPSDHFGLVADIRA
jgi:endonuclease/exonuclease/phosphatase family metal-dependent hydrolase